MSHSEIERFVADSTNQSVLRDALDGVTRLDDVVEIAREHNYLISIEDVRAHLSAGPALQVSDERLDAPTGNDVSLCGNCTVPTPTIFG